MDPSKQSGSLLAGEEEATSVPPLTELHVREVSAVSSMFTIPEMYHDRRLYPMVEEDAQLPEIEELKEEVERRNMKTKRDDSTEKRAGDSSGMTLGALVPEKEGDSKTTERHLPKEDVSPCKDTKNDITECKAMPLGDLVPAKDANAKVAEHWEDVPMSKDTKTDHAENKEMTLEGPSPVMDVDTKKTLAAPPAPPNPFADTRVWQESVLHALVPIPSHPSRQQPSTLGHAANNQPGAYLAAPGEATSFRERLCFSLVGIQLDDRDLEAPVSNTAGTGSYSGLSEVLPGLSEATLVTNEPSQDCFPQATQVEPASQKQEERQRQITCCAIVAIFLFFLLLAIGLGVGMSSSQQKEVHVEPFRESTSNFTGHATLEDQVKSLLPPETVGALADPMSPQASAFHWLMTDLEKSSFLSDSHIMQRFILATLYFATSGQTSWVWKQNWLNHSVHECLWYTKEDMFLKTFVTTAIYDKFLETFSPPDGPCDEQGLYQHLWLDANNLVGSLPEELYMLTSLTTLSLGYNLLQGSISSHIGYLTSLEGLHFSGLQHTGTIPTEIGLLTHMKYLGFHDNDHEGTVPNEIWKLTNLDTLGLGCANPPAQLTGTLPTEIGALSKLKWFISDRCAFTGSIPTEIGGMTALDWFAILHSTVTGLVPSEIGFLSNLVVLSLMGNGLSGALPSELGSLTQCTQMTFRDNTMSGTLPSEIQKLGKARLINFQNNSFSGKIPTELGIIAHLDELSLQGNQLTGIIPSELGLLTSMTLLGLANNSLSGSVPQELSALQPSLYSLQLEGNLLLSGALPQRLCAVNGTCVGDAVNPCEEHRGISFDCTNLLCGCGCQCL